MLDERGICGYNQQAPCGTQGESCAGSAPLPIMVAEGNRGHVGPSDRQMDGLTDWTKGGGLRRGA